MPSEQPTEPEPTKADQQALHDRQTVEVWLQELVHAGYLTNYAITGAKHYEDEGVTTIHADIVLPTPASEVGIILTLN